MSKPTQPAEIGGMVFFGNPMEVIPRRLIVAEELSPIDKLGWMLIKVASEHHQIQDIEQSKLLAQQLFPGAADDFEQLQVVILKLRLTRWLSACGASRGGANLYGIHDEATTVTEAMAIDQSYPALVASACNHEREDIRLLASSIAERWLPAPFSSAS